MGATSRVGCNQLNREQVLRAVPKESAMIALTDLARRLNATPAAVHAHLKYWVEKGRVMRSNTAKYYVVALLLLFLSPFAGAQTNYKAKNLQLDSNLDATFATLSETDINDLHTLADGMPDGTEALPGWPFVDDTDTGFWHPAANTIGISTNGVNRVTINDANLTIHGGSHTMLNFDIDGGAFNAYINGNDDESNSLEFVTDLDGMFFQTALGISTVPAGTGTLAFRDAPATSHILYVRKDGNDTTGDGSFSRPELTINAAIADIGTPSTTNRWVVDIGPGTYDEAVVLTKGWVTLRGAGRDATVIRHDVAASASSGLYAGPLKIHSGTWGSSHSGDTVLTDIYVRNLTLRNTPASDDGDVYCALVYGDPTKALADSAISTPPGGTLFVDNCHIWGSRDTVTMCGRGMVDFRNTYIQGGLDTVFPIGCDFSMTNCTIDNYLSNNATTFYLSGTMTGTISHSTILCDAAALGSAFSSRTDPRDTSNIVLNIDNTRIARSGAPSTLANMMTTVNNSTTSVYNVGPGVEFADDGNRNFAPSGGSFALNYVGVAPAQMVAGQRGNPGRVTARSVNATQPAVVAQAMTTSTNPALILQRSDIDSGNSNSSAVPPPYTPTSLFTSGTVLGDLMWQLYSSSAWGTAAKITCTLDGTASTSSWPSKLTFYTTAASSTTATSRMTIDKNGFVSISGKLYAATVTNAAGTATIAIPSANGTLAVSGSSPITVSGSGDVYLSAAVPANLGGTGQTTWTTGDLPYSSATNTVGKLGVGSTGDYLTVAAGVPAWTASLTSSSTRWQDFAASAVFVNGIEDPTAPMGWMNDVATQANLYTAVDSQTTIAPIPYGPGTTLKRIRVKWQGGSSSDGIVISLLRRDESGTTTAMTEWATYSPATSASVTLTTYDFGDETMAAGYSYSVKITAVVGASWVKLYSMGLETSGRTY